MTAEEFASLTHQEQVARIETLGRDALAQFGVEPSSISPLVHAENTTYRVESPQGTFCLRVSRPGYQSDANLESEIVFLAALRAASFDVPEPYEARVVKAVVPEVPEGRNCALLRWQEGTFCRDGYSPEQGAKVGKLMAELHNFSARWVPPPTFERQQLHAWAFENRQPPTLVAKPDSVAQEDFDLLVQVDREGQEMLRQLPRNTDHFGLIHADLHQGNVLFDGDDVRVIDFDDLGYGFWLYDFAAALTFLVDKEQYAAVRDALMKGYESVRPLPPGTEELLTPFIRLRASVIARWVLGRTDNPRMRERAGEFVHRFCTSIRKA